MPSREFSIDSHLSFGDRLRQVRRDRRLTLGQLSDLASLSISFLSDLERGRASPSLQSVLKLADALDTTPTGLLAGVDLADAPPTWPAALEELRADPEYTPLLTDDWMRTLARIQYRGDQPQTKHEWLELFLYLRRVLRPKD